MNDLRGRVTKDGIRIYSEADFAGMRAAGQVAAGILDAVIPLVKPGIVAVCIYTFLNAWDDYMMSLIIMQDASMKTLPVLVLTMPATSAARAGQAQTSSSETGRTRCVLIIAKS